MPAPVRGHCVFNNPDDRRSIHDPIKKSPGWALMRGGSMQRRCSMGQGGAIIHHIVKAVAKGHVVDKWSQILFQT